jgi:3-hydroxybutyryl-CoA dehydratase
MSQIRRKAIAGFNVGDSFTVQRTFTEADMTAFAGITRDYNPVHFDSRFSTVKGFSDRICHGLLVASMLTEVGGQMGWLASAMNFRFKKPVYFGDTVTCKLTVTDIDDRNRARAIAEYKNEDGVLVLEADLEGILPAAPEQEILATMVREGDLTNELRNDE